MRKLKLLFTNKYYRWATLELVKNKLKSLPVITHIISWYYTCMWYRGYKICKKMPNMGIEVKDIERKEVDKYLTEYSFLCALIRLKLCIMAENKNKELKELFEKAKSDILDNEIITKYKDFKEWVEDINFNEKDYSRVQELIDSFTTKT